MTYQRKMFLLLMSAIIGASLIGFVAGRLPALGLEGLPVWIAYPFYLALGALVFATAWPWWKRLDDLQRIGHMASWYWGGMAGAIAMIMWLLANGTYRSEFGQGVAYMMFAQFAGFLVYFAYWHVRGRGAAE